MNQVKNISQNEEKNVQSQEQNRFEPCEKVVEMLVEKGLPSSFSPSNFISKIAKSYGLSQQEARTCLKLAVKQLEATSKQEEKPKEKLNGQMGYFYPNSYSEQKNTIEKDGMDSLASLGNYNRLMFGLR